MVPLLSVRVTNNAEKTFSMFSRDPSRSLTLSEHCIRHAQWATNMSMWACYPPPFSIHWYGALSAIGKLAWAFVPNGRAVCSISTKQAFYSLKPPGKSYVPQVGVRLVRMTYFRFYNFPKIVFVQPVTTYQPRWHGTCTISAYMTNMNVYTEASATQKTFFYESWTYRRVSTDFFLPSIIAPP